MNNFEEVDKKLVKALMSFNYDSRPFWTLLSMRLKRVPSKNIESFCTVVTSNSVELHYNPDFVQKHEQSFLKYMFLHECLHLIYRHMFRFSFSKDMVDVGYLKSNPPKVYKPIAPVKSADLAADLAANRDLFVMFPDYQGYGVKHDDIQHFNMMDFALASAEDIEKYILDTYLPVQGGGSGGEGGGGGGKQKESKGKDSKVNGKPVPSHAPAANKTDSDLVKRVKQRMVEGMVSSAAREGSMGQGSLPESLKAELEILMQPPRKDWRAMLSEFVKCSLPKDSTRTWARINRRHPYLIKGKKPRRVPLIGVAMDTSGSVSDTALKAFLEEINHIRKLYGSDIDIVQCDCVISDVVHVKAKQRMPTYVSGRGGTEFTPALEWFDKAKRKPDVVVFFTDLEVGDDDVPDTQRSYNILWVSVNETMCEKFQSMGKYGKFIYMDVSEEENI